MTYFNRELQLNETLKSIFKSQHTNFEIVIVDDCSDTNLNIKHPNIHIIKINKEEKFWNNPVIVYNIGIWKSLEFNPEIIILQNAESYHFGDVLIHTNNNISKDNYISYGCFSLNNNDTFSNIGNYENNIPLIINSNKRKAEFDCDSAWYNHPIYRPVGYEFCSAILTENLLKLNGYDERYADCIWYGDDDLKLRIDRLGLNTYITTFPDEPIVLHQFHDHSYIDKTTKDKNIKRGSELFQDLKNNPHIYKAIHKYTKNFT